ncbi:hypothetical protein TrCOL_g1988 [Triparma columacea]|uniref:Uncharacterized protein n=1 Tax=Triparma columacea TaxID=722753 RepID=A0A9W7L912_9STRA|nr:hypothetical protein TrCOL_g1988 [Triparma columacea]
MPILHYYYSFPSTISRVDIHRACGRMPAAQFLIRKGRTQVKDESSKKAQSTNREQKTTEVCRRLILGSNEHGVGNRITHLDSIHRDHVHSSGESRLGSTLSCDYWKRHEW